MADAVKVAIRAGYRFFDLAKLYGNEREIGKAINECISDGEVTRGDLFICSKLWNTDHDPADVEGACRKSLDDIGLDYLDTYMMHWPVQWSKDSKLLSGEFGGQFDFENLHMGDPEKTIA